MTVRAVTQDHPAAQGMRAAGDAVRELLPHLGADTVWTCPNADVIGLLRAHAELASMVEAVGLVLVREADVRCLSADDGQVSTASWLATMLTLHPAEAKTRVRTADVLARKAPDTAAALAAGELNPGQVRAIASALASISSIASPEEFAAAEKMFHADGRGQHPGNLARMGRHLREVLDPDGSPDRADAAAAARGLTLTNLGDGKHRLRGTLDDEGAAVLKAAIDSLAAPRPAEGGERDPRSAPQRRVDALIEVCNTFLRFGDLGSSRGARPHVHVTVSWETLRGDTGHPFARTATGEDLSIDTIRKMACDAGITPILINTLGEPLAVGRESRTVTPAIWAALVARDLGCVFDGCTRPAAWCHGHHILFWGDDGETSLENTALVCHFHHDQIHHHGWQVRLGADGHPDVIPPPWVDPLRQPRRNLHWKLLRDGLRTDPDRGP